MYTKKSNGPRILPWGTPIVILAGGENASLQIVCWNRREWYERNHAKLFPATPRLLSLLTRIKRSTVSKALRKSKNTAPITHPLSMLSRIWSVNSIRAVDVERFWRKPNCDCDNNSFCSTTTGAIKFFSLNKLIYNVLQVRDIHIKIFKCCTPVVEIVHSRKSVCVCVWNINQFGWQDP